MSQAPVRRKSRQALAAASRKPAPHHVVLRVKRKRGDDPVESLLVSTDEGTSSEGKGMPDRKRRAPGGTGLIEETLAGLSLDKTAAEQQHQLQQQHQQQQKNEVQPPKRLFYKRVRTTEPDGSGDRKKERRPATVAPPPTAGACMSSGGGGRLDAPLSSRSVDPLGALSLPPPRPTAALDFMEVRRVKARAVGHAQAHGASAEGPGGLGGREQRTTSPSSGVASGTSAADFHVIDLQAVGTRDNDDMDTSGMGGGAAAGGEAAGGVAAEKRTAAPILSPGERQMDEAVFKAFQTGDLSSLRGLLTTCSPATPAGVNYRRRLGDATTPLMAAAFHGDLDTVRHLLSLGAKASLVDAGGRSAAMFAGMRGHRECFAELQRVADEEEKEQRARTTKRRGSTAAGGAGGAAGDDGHDFVYDLYYFEPSASESPSEGASASGGGGGTGVPTASGKVGERASDAGSAAPPVVRLSGIGPVDESAVGMMADVELEFEHDSDWSELGQGDDGEDPDSNSEGYYGNDYPEDEGDEDDGRGAAPYIYGAGSGSSCASESGSSNSGGGGGGGFDSDSDIEQYSRRVVEMMPEEEDGLSGGGGFGVAGLAGSMPPTMGGAEEADSTFHAGLGLGSASVFAWEPNR